VWAVKVEMTDDMLDERGMDGVWLDPELTDATSEIIETPSSSEINLIWGIRRPFAGDFDSEMDKQMNTDHDIIHGPRVVWI